MTRHYNALVKEMKKSKPCPLTVNSYLNKEFPARRNWLKSTNANSRCTQLLEAYPCFKNHEEIIEEVRRIMGGKENKETNHFMKACLERLSMELDVLIYYGMTKKSTGHPSRPTLNSKLVHLILNLNAIFTSTSKASKLKKADIMEVLKDYEDPEMWVDRRSGNAPIILKDNNNAYLVAGHNIVTTISVTKLNEALLAFLGLFYVLDVDYPKSSEMGLVMLQNLIFKDTNTPADIMTSFEMKMADYQKFKDAEE